jgi:hypothetical protein
MRCLTRSSAFGEQTNQSTFPTTKDIIKSKPEATQCSAFNQWAADNDDVMS